MEIWKNAFGKYRISNTGKVMNGKTGRILKQNKDKDGYFVVCLCECGVNHTKKVHRIVAEAFVENKFGKPGIDHIDGNKENNEYTNLRWVTPKENSNNPITLERIRKNCKPIPRTRPVLCVEMNIVFQSAKDAGESTNADASCIAKCCKGKRATAGGYQWKYAI